MLVTASLKKLVIFRDIYKKALAHFPYCCHMNVNIAALDNSQKIHVSI
jgi:hypothetical protein